MAKRVEYLKFDGDEYPIVVDFYALKRLQHKAKGGLEKLDTDLSLYEPFLYYAMERGAVVTETKMEFKMVDMERILCDCYFDFVEMIPKFFARDEDQSEKPTVGEEQ